MTETEVLLPHEAEPVKFDEESTQCASHSDSFAEDISILNFLSFDDYKDTEISFKMQFDGFDDLEIIIMNAENHTAEEVELAKKLLIEKNEKLKVSRGRDFSLDYPDYELFDNLDYTFEKMKFEELKNDEKQ